MLPVILAALAVVASPVATLPDHLTLTAPKGTDYYGTGATGNFTAPVVVTPVTGDFVLAARVTFHINNLYDGAALVVRADDTHWAKFLIERPWPGVEYVTSSVVRGTQSDDNYHVRLKPGQETVWLKVTHTGDRYGLYTSEDGKTWTIARDFALDTTAPVSVGVEAQSPLGPEFTAVFDQVRLEHRTAKDYWQGE